jgi:hypothetical protein
VLNVTGGRRNLSAVPPVRPELDLRSLGRRKAEATRMVAGSSLASNAHERIHDSTHKRHNRRRD